LAPLNAAVRRFPWQGLRGQRSRLAILNAAMRQFQQGR